MEDREIKPKWMAVRLDETEFWNGDFMDKVESIHAHYLYDENTVTRICSAATNYFLRFVGFDYVMKEGFEDDSEEVYVTIMDGYASESQDDYYRTSRIDKIPIDEKGDRCVFMEWEDMKSWAKDYGEQRVFDELHEAYSAGPLW
jgi:hypothetical protein